VIPSSQILVHPAAIRLLFNPQIFECFEKLMQAEYSVVQLARVLERTVGQVFYRVGQLLEHDLIVITRTEARAGRAVQYYRSSASSYWVSFEHTPSENLGALYWQVLQPYYVNIVQGLVGSMERKEAEGWGIHLGIGPQGGLNIRLANQNTPHLTGPSSATPSSAVAVSYLTFEDLQLDHTQAQAFKLELQELLSRYVHERGSHPYRFHAGLVLDPL
jgi:hypothetical protein